MLTELIEAGEEPGQRSAGGNNTEARRRRALVSLLRQMQFKVGAPPKAPGAADPSDPSAHADRCRPGRGAARSRRR